MIRIYTPYFPYPLTEGAFHVIHDQAKSLKQRGHRVELIHWKSPQQEPFTAKVLRVAGSLFSDLASPETYYYARQDAPEHTTQEVADLGIYHFSLSYPWLKFNTPRPEKKIIVHFHNLESELFELRKHHTPFFAPGSAAIHALNAAKLKRHELDLATLADELWFLSSVDHERYHQRLKVNHKHANTRIVPPTIDPQVRSNRQIKFLKQVKTSTPPVTTIGLLGRYDFEPNRASLEWVIRELAPRLQSGGFQGRLQVIGPHVPPDLKKIAGQFPWVEILGFVPDLESFWSSVSFVLAPQQGGSGVRIKLLEALGSGVPVLAHASAAAPLDPKLQKSAFLTVSDDPDFWATCILNETPYKTRTSLQHIPFESALSGQSVYEFLGPPADDIGAPH